MDEPPEKSLNDRHGESHQNAQDPFPLSLKHLDPLALDLDLAHEPALAISAKETRKGPVGPRP